MSSSFRHVAVALVAAVAVAACGGGDDARSVLSDGDETTAETDVAPTDAPSTDAPSTDAPVSEPPATDPPATDAPPVTLAATTTAAPTTTLAPSPTIAPTGPGSAYCGASAQFFVEAQALDEIDEGDDAAARRLFELMQVSLSATLLNAPDEAAAATPRRMEEVLAVLLPAFDQIDYDTDALGQLPNADEVQANLTTFVEIVDRLEAFLVESCGVDRTALDGQAVELAGQIGSGPATTDSPDDPPEPPPGVPSGVVTVTDDSGTIEVQIPDSWTQVLGAPDGELRQLIAAPDIDAFLAAYDSPGVVIISGDAAPGTGDTAATGALDGFAGAIESDGCGLNVSASYDDGVYTGEERVYSCPGAPENVRLAAGSNDGGDVFWLLAVVPPVGDADVWDLITETFFVD